MRKAGRAGCVCYAQPPLFPGGSSVGRETPSSSFPVGKIAAAAAASSFEALLGDQLLTHQRKMISYWAMDANPPPPFARDSSLYLFMGLMAIAACSGKEKSFLLWGSRDQKEKDGTMEAAQLKGVSALGQWRKAEHLPKGALGLPTLWEERPPLLIPSSCRQGPGVEVGKF